MHIMEPFTFLFAISIAMFIGSYIAGSLPLITNLPDRKIRILNALGAGLFIGTSLMVVIPEGVNTIYSSQLPDRDSTFSDSITKRASNVEDNSAHTAIGLALIIGFSFMFVIDQVSTLHVSPTAASDIEYAELSTVVGGGALDQEEMVDPSVKPPLSITPTIGLVVHAAADGIALGASVSDPQLSMVVFLAVMLHKAPASFALTSVLLVNGLSRDSIRKHLILFASSAPLGAILTYLTLKVFSSTFSSSLEYWTGVLLVFSGGTFLYVAMHALQEATQHPHNHYNRKEQTTTMVILGGMLVPILLSTIDID